MRFLALVTATVGLSAPALAVDVTQCPKAIGFQATAQRVFKDSMYSKTPGWQQARKDLKDAGTLEVAFTLVRVRNERCLYADESGNTATLTTTLFRDPELPNPVAETQLIANFKIGTSKYVTYLPVRSYSPEQLKAPSTPFNLKVKAKLYSEGLKRNADFDIGTINVSID